jgi:predicted nucleic acid-binding protein
VIAVSRGEAVGRAFIKRARLRGARVVVPSVVVAETYRGGRGPNAAVEHLLSTIDEIAPASESTGREAGRLRATARANKTIDAIVIATALELGEADILTSDAKDLRALSPRTSAVQIHAL